MSSNAHRLGDAALGVTRRMRELLAIPGALGGKQGAQELRELYQDRTMLFDPELLNEFAFQCYTGSFANMKRMLNTGEAPPLSHVETPFGFGYATLVITGSQRIQRGPPGACLHEEALQFLLEQGCPPDVEDICGYTALHHATMIPSTPPKLARILLDHGANVNHQNRYGGSPIVGAIVDADGHVTGDRYHNYGPAVTAVVAKWLRKRAGEQAPPLDGKKCDFCEKTGGELKMCAACHSARYCSSSCQRSHWKTHKQTCKSFTPANTITLKPNYEGHRNTIPIADLTRNVMGITGAPSIQAHHLRGVHQPSSYPKKVIIKVQVPLAGNGGLYVYTKKRDFVCSVLRKDSPSGYDRISQVIREKGVGRAKGYFAGELKSADELVVKVGEILAEQPF